MWVPCSHLKSKGDRAFSVAAPRLCKSSLFYIVLLLIGNLQLNLKTYLFSQAFRSLGNTQSIPSHLFCFFMLFDDVCVYIYIYTYTHFTMLWLFFNSYISFSVIENT